MVPTQLKMIKLASSLPQKDINIAVKFIESRDFDSLLELVDSDIKKYSKYEEEGLLTKSINMSDMELLKSEVEHYLYLINGSDAYSDFDPDFDIEDDDYDDEEY